MKKTFLLRKVFNSLSHKNQGKDKSFLESTDEFNNVGLSYNRQVHSVFLILKDLCPSNQCGFTHYCLFSPLGLSLSRKNKLPKRLKNLELR